MTPIERDEDAPDPGANPDGDTRANGAGQPDSAAQPDGDGQPDGAAETDGAAGPEREEELIPIAGRLALVIGRINRRIRSSSGGLSHGMLSALATVVRKGPIKAGELARLEVVSAPTLTRALADLESRGLVAREVDPTDRRSFYVVATHAGTELVVEATSERARLVAHLLAEIAPEDLLRIEQTLGALEAVANAPAA